KQVENRGMKFVTLEVSAQTLNQKTLEEFNRVVTESGNQPLFVYDRDGGLATNLWYLQFRAAQDVGHDQALQQAKALGLREDREGTHRDMWLAAQKYLKDNPR